MSEAVLFTLLTLLTNVLFGAISAAFLLRLNQRWAYPPWPLALIGLGLGPYLMSVMLYYPMALWEDLPVPVLIAFPVLFFAALAWQAGKGWSILVDLLGTIQRLLADRSMWFFLLGSAMIMFITIIFLANKPLVDHDVLEYAIQGRIFLRDGHIPYDQFRFDASSGFHYVGLHGFSFPLLFTWEGLLGNVFGVSSDLWARSMTMWYGWLLVAFVWAILRGIDRWVAVAGGIALTSSLAFLFMFTVYHLDSYRIFFFTVSVAAFIALFRAPSLERALFLALLCGAVSFIHSIGAILTGVLWFVVAVMLPVPLLQRSKWIAYCIGVMLAAGAVHYVVDVLFGTGWIFQDIIWY